VVSSPAGPVNGSVHAIARHPLGRAADQQLRFTGGADGTYGSTTPLPAGRWLLNVVVTSGKNEGRFDTEIPA
jgi:nitrogen fixation protein FixH